MNRYTDLLVRWRLPLFVAMICITAQATGWVDTLRFERALLSSEPWRLLSGHLTHLGWIHLALNLAGLALIWTLFGHELSTRLWGIAIVLCALAVSGGLYLHDTHLNRYVGLSGVLHGMLILGSLASLRTEYRTASLVLGVVTAKLAWEQITGTDTGTNELVGGKIIVNAHLYGALAGIACAPLAHIWRLRQVETY